MNDYDKIKEAAEALIQARTELKAQNNVLTTLEQQLMELKSAKIYDSTQYVNTIDGIVALKSSMDALRESNLIYSTTIRDCYDELARIIPESLDDVEIHISISHYVIRSNGFVSVIEN